MHDIVRSMGPLFLGSRLKRLGERLQAETLRFVASTGLPVQPSQYPVLAALDRSGAQTVGELVAATGVSQPAITRALANLTELGLVENREGAKDQRTRTVGLSARGRVIMERSRNEVWPFVDAAVVEIISELRGPIMQQVAAIEDALDATPLDQRASSARANGLSVIEYSDELAQTFHDINAEWISTMFALEATDKEVLTHPRERLIEPGGAILFVRAEGLGIVGTCALQKTGATQFELTKMGVLASARGRKAGEYLLRATIRRAEALGAQRLYLLTNSKCAPAIHLYEKAGFRHDAGIMREFGSRYQRCDVAMLYAP